MGDLRETVPQNKEIIAAESAITASITVSTEFATVYSVQVTQKRTTAPALDSIIYTYDVASDGTVSIFAWQTTAAADSTLIPGTVPSTISYIIIGRRRQ